MTRRNIAIASDGIQGLEDRVSPHFGRCPAFTLVTVADGRVLEARVVPNPWATGHKPGVVPRLVRREGAETVLAGRIGAKAAKAFETTGVEVIAGLSGRVGDLAQAYALGELKPVAAPHQGGGHGHRHEHDHCGGHGHGHCHAHGR
ncbi:MAG: NifB/NifX family molybdenum-iron cluster-binding protein [Myxococcota bacterium]